MSASGPVRLIKLLLVVQALVLVPQAWAKEFVGIVDYRPSTFIEHPTAPFFYSIGNKLRFGKVIVDGGPVLFEAKPSDEGIWAVYVSPDETKAAVASGGNLYLVQQSQAPVLLLRDSYDLIAGSGAKKGPIEKLVYDYRQLQWDPSSRFFYIPRGAWRNRYPSHMALMRIDVADPANVLEITNDASGHAMFLVGGDAACFKRVVNRGDLIWRCVDKGIEKSPKAVEEHRIVMDDGTTIEGKPFASYPWSRGGIWLTGAGFSIRAYNGRWGFFSKDWREEPIFQFTGAAGSLKGYYSDGVYEVNCSVLPGERYAFLDLLMDNFKGGRAKVLVDGRTGGYREVPRDTLVYRNLNSSTYDGVEFGLHWGDRPEFKPKGELRPYRR